MTFPLYQLDAFGQPTAKVLAIVLGLFFGIVLERNGFGRSTILAAQFYGRDNRVLKVMFSAIVTALVGLAFFRTIGLLDWSAMVVPKTFLYPMIFGGLLFGVGFVVSGYCPGTSVVAMASRKIDGALTFLGIVLGSVLFGILYPLYESFYLSGDLGVYRLPDLLHVPEPVVILAVVAMAIGAFLGAETLERKLARKDHESPPVSVKAVRNAVFIVLGIFAFSSFTPVQIHTTQARQAKVGKMDPWTLARTIVKDPGAVEILCLRREVPKVVIPGAERYSKGVSLSEYLEGLPGTQTLVMVLDNDAPTPYEQLGNYTGRITRLAGGYEAFAGLFLMEPKLSDDAGPEDIRNFEERYALYRFMTGSKSAGPRPKRKPKKVKRKLKKDGGCG